MIRKFTDQELMSIRMIINSEINIKLNVLLAMCDPDSNDTVRLREIVRSIVERSIESWGFTPAEIAVIGPNDDSKFTVDFSIDMTQANSLID